VHSNWPRLPIRCGQPDELWVSYFSRPVREKQCINKIKSFFLIFWLLISVHPTTVGQFQSVTGRAVESVHKNSKSDSDSDSSIFKTSDSDSFIKTQYVLIMVNL
jgi:hypothetical protein